MPNILLTYRCNQECPYCFAKKKKENEDMSIENLRFVLDFFKKNNEMDARLLGGEPTCHPEFRKIINMLLQQKFRIRIFTNGLFSESILNFLKSKGKSITYDFNINEMPFYDKAKWEKIKRNVRNLNHGQLFVITFNIFRTSFIYKHLEEIIASNPIDALQIRITNPILNQSNIFLSQDKYKLAIRKIGNMLKYLDSMRTIKPFTVVFGCGFSRTEGNEIKKIKIGRSVEKIEIKYGCLGNSGKFDIAPDLTVFRCLPLSSWKTKKLSAFGTVDMITGHFDKNMEKEQNTGGKNYLSDGPCFSYLLAGRKKEVHL